MEIKIKESKNKIEVVKDDSIKYVKISKYTHVLVLFSIIISFIFFKIRANITFLTFLLFAFLESFLIYYWSLGIKNKYINEVLKINLENIKLEFWKDGDIVYSKDIPRWKVIKIKKEVANFKIYPNTEFFSIFKCELVDKRILKIITKDEVFSWGYKVEEVKIDEIIKLIKEFWNIED